MTVRERMSRKPVVIAPQYAIDAALALLEKHRLRHLLVVRAARLVGIVSDRDLRAAPAHATTVGEVMTQKPRVVAPDVSVDEAARLMQTSKISALPVVEDGKLVGILTSNDVLGAFVDLSGVAEPSCRLVISGAGASGVPRIREILARGRCEVRWLHVDGGRRRGQVHVRLRARNVNDVVTALEAAGFQVSAVVRSSGCARTDD